MKETCENCKFRVNEICHRFPPNRGIEKPCYIYLEYWCGEWQDDQKWIEDFPNNDRRNEGKHYLHPRFQG